METIAVIGASGSVGGKVCRAALDDGRRVVAIDRSFEAREADDRLDHRVADVLTDDLADVLQGCDAVISTLGLAFGTGTIADPPPLYSKGSAAIIAAMHRLELRRLAVISAAFVVPQPALPLWFTLSVVPALHAILDEMRAMERLVTASGLDWTIARPGWLLDEPATGTLLEGDGLLPDGAFRCREGDLARFLVDVVVDGRWIGGRPALGAPADALDESPLALGKAAAGMARAACAPRS